MFTLEKMCVLSMGCFGCKGIAQSRMKEAKQLRFYTAASDHGLHRLPGVTESQLGLHICLDPFQAVRMLVRSMVVAVGQGAVECDVGAVSIHDQTVLESNETLRCAPITCDEVRVALFVAWSAVPFKVAVVVVQKGRLVVNRLLGRSRRKLLLSWIEFGSLD